MEKPQTFCGMDVYVTETAIANIPPHKWDWSAYRSPSRAKRRRDRSKIRMQEPACFKMGRRLIIHPTLWAELLKNVNAR